MKCREKLLSPQFARPAARYMKVLCYLIMAFYLLCLLLSCLGRQSFRLTTAEEVYENAIYAETDHAPASRGLTVRMDDPVYVHANGQGEVDAVTQLALTLMFAIKVVPGIWAYWLLSRVLDHVGKGSIFTDENADGLLAFGLIQGVTALLAPFLRLGLCALANLLGESQVSISTGSDMLNTRALSVAFVVAASIIHYGIHLQDEVDHTL